MIAVTGATGHIGNTLVRELLAAGEHVRAILPPGDDPAPLAGLAVELSWADVRDRRTLEDVLEGAEIVYHLAGIVSIVPGRRQLLTDVNVTGTRNVVEVCRRVGVRRLVYTSSVHALVEPPHGTWLDEDALIDPLGVPDGYARSKALATNEVRQARETGLNAIIVFPSGVIGPFDYRRSEIGQLISDYVTGKLKVFIDGWYDFVDVRDIARGLVLAGKLGSNGGEYILSGTRVSVRELLELLQQVSGIPMPKCCLPLPVARMLATVSPLYYRLSGQIPRLTPYAISVLRSNSLISSAKAQRELDYATRPISETIRDTVAWHLER